MNLFEWIAAYTQDDPSGGRAIRVTANINENDGVYTTSLPSGGRAYKVVLVGGGGGGTSITVVRNFSSLPDPTTVSGQFYWCEESEGTWWLPGSLGGTYYNSGMYYSNGVSWTYMESPYQATQAQVDTGLLDDVFVSPLTLKNAAQWGTVVPYKGATGNVDLGSNTLQAGKIGVGITPDANSLFHAYVAGAISRMILDGDSGHAKIFSFRTGNLQRWAFRVSDNETGSNAGANFFIRRYDDAGNFIDAAITITRSSGAISTSGPVNGATPTEMSRLAGVASNIQNQLNSKLTIVAFDLSLSTANTGSTTSNLVRSILIPAGTFTNNSIGYLHINVSKSGTAGVMTCRSFIHTSAGVGGVQVSTTSGASATVLIFKVERDLNVFDASGAGNGTRHITGTMNTASEIFGVTAAYTFVTSGINWNVDQYWNIFLQNGSAGDSTFVAGTYVAKV